MASTPFSLIRGDYHCSSLYSPASPSSIIRGD
uniref:Uncharacterized protein n=1 Tax=Arundo donax TaxID=35708 RepID=A0A0A8YKM2_ARUDO